MTTYTHTTPAHRIDVSCWASNALNFQIHIDGNLYTEGSSLVGSGDTEESEAMHQAEQTAADIESGRLAMIDGEWKLVEEVA